MPPLPWTSFSPPFSQAILGQIDQVPLRHLPALFQFLQREIVLLAGRHAASPLVNVFLLRSICSTRMNQSSLIHKCHIPDKTMSTTLDSARSTQAEKRRQ